MIQIDGDINDFRQAWGAFKDRIPPDTLCFQYDPGGSLFLIGTGAANLGRVYFWDRGCEAD